MSIKDRLIASNIAMVVIPFILFILFEILLATLLFGRTNGTADNFFIFYPGNFLMAFEVNP
ncbi:hypothetical protein ABE41_006345 [Fictibacillus arsenicus]|uniref:Uncharacterized protein n=1 Tax=Fictibacillus arsenicus TaxID=255247 RepID=A0A1B1Z2K9_9BACL|nr:hypothetical protein [Fictibacillus arsenicus]ANX11621.1 hypothetical protein ABE41_006345 [Fictibacillus arsenicus]